MNRYRLLRAGRIEVPGVGALLRLADQARRDGDRGAWIVKGIVADGQVGEGSAEELGLLIIDKDGVELREVEPAGTSWTTETTGPHGKDRR